MPSPNAGSADSDLKGIAMTSARNGWAVGDALAGLSGSNLVLVWNGRAWKMQPAPDLGTGPNALIGVAAVSTTDAWAVGSFTTSATQQNLALHCC